MLSPRKAQVILLPEDKHLIDMLGWSEDQYRYFVRQASTYNSIRPGEPVAFLFVPFLIKLVIGLALSYLASRLTRRQSNAPAQLNTNQIDGQNIVSGGRYAPRTGFGSTQNVVEMGSVIPLVFANRERIAGVWYGGVRVNTNLLWSQLLSIGTGQILRAVFMVGEGPIGALDPRQFAIGDNLLGSYDLDSAGNTSGRCSIYFRPGGGLIRATDHIAGRLAAYDDGNAENSGGASVFDVRGVNQAYGNAFCYVSKPNNQTAFGVYSGMGNNLGYRVNPTIRSTSNPQLKPFGRSGASYVTCNWDSQGKADRFKQNTIFSSRSGMWAYNGAPTSDGQTISLNIGDTVDYHLSSSSDYGTVFAWLLPPIAIAKCIDVAQTIAGRQRQWDDSIVVGELYKFGQSLLICISRTPDDAVFISEADSEPAGGGQSITARFRVIKGGLGIFTSAAEIGRGGLTPGGVRNNGTQRSHLFRCAVSSFVVDRPTQVIEIGYKSTLGIRYSGLCNFRDSYSYFWSDLISCDLYAGAVVGEGQTFNTSSLTSGTISLPEKRYSFFRILYRVAGSDADFTEIDVNFCFCSQTEQPSFNYVRLQFPSAERWEVMHRPTTGWEIRNNLCAGPLLLLDARSAGLAKTGSASGVVFNYSGEYIANGPGTFGLAPTIPKLGDIGLGGADGAGYVDAYGALAEMFLFEEIQSTANQPEHEIAYVNLISPNPTIPTYANMATVGLTLRSGPGFSELSQFSVYMNQGYNATHLFPECYYVMLTNDVFGTGEVLSSQQINIPSFDYSAAWTKSRKYFFDMGISEPFNIRSKGAEWAKLFLLDLSTKNGQFYLSPIAEFSKVYQPTALFTSGNANSVEVTERDSQERQPIRVSVKWREERQASDISGRGLFPIIREVTVREAGTPDSAPLVPIDMSAFCTSEVHAIDAGKMRCREQVLITHDVNLNVIPDRAAIEPGAIVKVGLELLAYEQPNNGVILADGTATTTSGTPLSTGNYDIVLWDGTTENLTEVTVAVVNGRVTGYANAVFCIADAVQTTQVFKVQVIDYDDEGNLDVIASYFPLEADGTSSLLRNWTTPGAWVIEGLVGALPPDVPLSPVFSAVRISGLASAVVATPYIYVAEIDGPGGAYTYSWTGTNATIASPSAASTSVTFPAGGSAILNLTVTQTVGGTVRSTSKTVNVTLTSANDVNIGATPPSYRIGAGTFALTANVANPFTTATYSWTISGQGVLATPTAANTLLTVNNTEGSRFISLSAVVDGTNYSAIRVVNVYADEPLTIGGASLITTGDTLYRAVLGSGVAPEGWAYSWSVLRIPPVSPPSAIIEITAPAPVIDVGATVTVPSVVIEVNPVAPEVTGTPFDPLTLSPVAWWDASDASSITTSGGLITNWNDKSGNNWHLAQTTSTQRPVYGTALVNGLNVAQWPATNNDDFMQSAAGTFTFREFYVVARYTHTSFTNYQGLFNYANNAGSGWFGGAGGGLGLYLTGNFDIYVNGNNTTNRSSNLWPELGQICLMRCVAPTNYTTNDGVTLGMDRLYGGLGRGWWGEICELIPVATVLSVGDRTDLETYLIDKWRVVQTQSLFLAHLTGADNSTSFPDSSIYAATGTAVGNTKIRNTQTLFSQNCAYFDGNSDTLTFPHSTALDLSKRPAWTIQFFVYQNSRGAGTALISKDGVFSSSYPSYSISIDPSGNMSFNIGSGNGLSSIQSVSIGNLPLTTMTHVAAVLLGSTLYTFRAGTLITTATKTATITDGGKALYLGSQQSSPSTEHLDGFLREAVITPEALWTANFTPPAAPWADP